MLLFILFLQLLAAVPSAADSFTNPSEAGTDLTSSYKIGQSINVAWSSSVSKVTLVLAVWGSKDVGVLLSNANNGGSFTWNIGQNDNVNEDLLKGNTNFVLLLRDPSGQTKNGNGWVDGQLQSRAFRLLPNAVSSSSTTSSSSTSSTLSSTSSSTTMSTSVVATSSGTSQQSAAARTPEATGLSDGARIGIGVGSAFGGLLLIAISVGGTVCFLRRRKRDVKAEPDKWAPEPAYDTQIYRKEPYQTVRETPSSGYVPLAELSS